MSVAFRREGDDDHLEPTFELPIPPGPNRVTATGLALIGRRLAALDTALASEADETRIKALRREQRYWQTRQSTAELMPIPDGSQVAFGCTVSFSLNGATRTITIVGDDEADPKQDKLAFSAPLPRAMIGAEPGETIDFAGRADAITILSISVQPAAPVN